MRSVLILMFFGGVLIENPPKKHSQLQPDAAWKCNGGGLSMRTPPKNIKISTLRNRIPELLIERVYVRSWPPVGRESTYVAGLLLEANLRT